MGITILIFAFGVALGFILAMFLFKSGNIKESLSTASNAANLLREAFPNISAFTVVDKIFKYAIQGTEAAEQLYKSGEIRANQRKNEAISIVKSCASIAGINDNSELQKIISAAIESAVNALPKTHET